MVEFYQSSTKEDDKDWFVYSVLLSDLAVFPRGCSSMCV